MSDQAYPFIHQSIVALGFPDMLPGPGDFFTRLITHRAMLGADVMLGLFPADQPFLDIGTVANLDKAASARRLICPL